MKNADKIKIAALYVFLFAGGLWHILGYFQQVMAISAGPLLIVLGGWLFVEYLQKLNRDRKNKKKVWLFTGWAVLVICSSFLTEYAGVKTGIIFGSYAYGDVLLPQIGGVPIAIGFAWLLMLLSSVALMQRMPYINNSHVLLKTLIIAALMTFFDFMMEPAAIKLGYWSWAGHSVPLQNYAAWFILGWILAWIGSMMDLFSKKQPLVAVHAYFAQLIYFIMILFK